VSRKNPVLKIVAHAKARVFQNQKTSTSRIFDKPVLRQNDIRRHAFRISVTSSIRANPQGQNAAMLHALRQAK
jgi:hypothetical protein